MQYTARRWSYVGLVAIVSLCCNGTWVVADPAAPAHALNFNRDIRPILSDHCFQCHGPDEKKREAGLRLDLRDAATRPVESGAVAIVPGDAAKSELTRRIHSTDPDERMPPKGKAKPLSDSQKQLLERWIASGAAYEGHWAFAKPVRPAVPEVKAASHVKNPVDAFLLSRLERDGLGFSPPAEKTTLIRRVSLDLVGLPPTLAEVDAFLADTSPQAYEKVVDRLLASPHYGERMALPWLDLARYADSNGFQTDSSRRMSPWRDWVIEAFNRNLTFDQFTIEQLAGDMLPNATTAQIVATGFHRNHRLNGEGGRIVEEWFAENVIDRVETTGLTWMGLTLGCSRCHDHKYDPISQKEFYQLFAFFNSIDESGVIESEGGNRGGGNSKPVLPLAGPEQVAELAKLEAAVQAAEQTLASANAELPKRQVAWETEIRQQLKDKTPAWQPLEVASAKSEGGADLVKQDDGSYLAQGKNPAHDVYVIAAPLPAGAFSGLLLEVFPDQRSPNESLGRAPNGNFVLSGVEVDIAAPGLAKPIEVDFSRAAADYEQQGWEVNFLVSAKPKRGPSSKDRPGWAVDGNDPAKRLPRKALFAVATPVTVPANANITIQLRHDSMFADHNIGRFRLSTSSLPPAALKIGGSTIAASIRKALEAGETKRTPAQKAELLKFFRENTDNAAKQAEVAVAAAKKQLADYRDDVPTVMVMKELPQPREAHILLRGEYDKLGAKVERGLPACLPPLPAGAPMNRLGFAQWMVSPEHPLTARVWVNRTWEKFFGAGLVKTTENFGSQADFPSHPELLDWLACEFMQPSVSPTVGGQPAQPWDMKAFQKLLAMSGAYQQASRVTPELLKRDPENRLLARGPRFRLSGELVRDQALALSGLLVPTIGGPSVRPYMPAGVWDETSMYGDLRNYKADEGAALYRRAMYTIWKRTAAPPSMMLFDAPNREICTVKRSRTNTPLQALALLNEVTYVESARKLAERMVREGGGSPEDRVRYGFRLVTCRAPQPAELKVLTDGLAADLAAFANKTDAAQKLLATGASPVDAKTDSAELAAYTLTANVLLNLDEVVTRE